MTSTITSGSTTLNGDPDAIRATGRNWRTAAMGCAAAAAQVGAVAVVDSFLGDESTTWEQRIGPDTSERLGTLATARDIVGGALVSYAEVLDDCQQELHTLAVHRTEAGAALDRWRDTPSAEPGLIDSATQTVHDLDARVAAVLARHAAGVRACCVQIERAAAMSPGHIAGVRSGVSAASSTGGSSGRFRQSSNAVLAGFSMAHPAQLSAIGPFLATDEPLDIDNPAGVNSTDGNSSTAGGNADQWLDPATRERYFQSLYQHCLGTHPITVGDLTGEGNSTDAGCRNYAESALSSPNALTEAISVSPGLIAMPPLPKTTFADVWNDYIDALSDMGGMADQAAHTIAQVMIGGCMEGGNLGACLFDIATAPIPFVKGPKVVKAAVEIVDEGADVVKAGEKAADAEKATEKVGDADRATDKATQADPVAKRAEGATVDRSVRPGAAEARRQADQIAAGHAYEKHVIKKREFSNVQTREEFAEHIADVIAHGERRPLRDGRVAYWKDGTFVVRNPRDRDGGSAYRPDDGYEYFQTQR